MIRVICDRCGADLTGQEELGYISMMYKYAKDGDISGCELMGMNPWEKNHYCENCMEQIRDYIKCAPPSAEQEREQNIDTKQPCRRKKAEGKKSTRHRIDYGKIKALHDASWSNDKIADEMGMSKASVSQALSKIKYYPELTLRNMAAGGEQED